MSPHITFIGPSFGPKIKAGIRFRWREIEKTGNYVLSIPKKQTPPQLGINCQSLIPYLAVGHYALKNRLTKLS
jgi:hypothetical protein